MMGMDADATLGFGYVWESQGEFDFGEDTDDDDGCGYDRLERALGEAFPDVELGHWCNSEQPDLYLFMKEGLKLGGWESPICVELPKLDPDRIVSALGWLRDNAAKYLGEIGEDYVATKAVGTGPKWYVVVNVSY